MVDARPGDRSEPDGANGTTAPDLQTRDAAAAPEVTPSPRRALVDLILGSRARGCGHAASRHSSFATWFEPDPVAPSSAAATDPVPPPDEDR